jgi:hypothetical protein
VDETTYSEVESYKYSFHAFDWLWCIYNLFPKI